MKNYEELLRELSSRDDRIIAMTAENRGPFRGLSVELGKRMIDVGIAEQTLIGMAAGLALAGKIPVVHAFSTFMTMRAFEFIRTDIGLPRLPVKLIGSANGILSEANGPTHQALEDIGLMRGIPHVNIFCPADAEDLNIGMPAILDSPEPFYVRFTNRAPAYEHSEEFKIGKAETVSVGSDITILAYGALFTETLEAVETLKQKGYSVGLINVRTLKPIDTEAVTIAAANSKLLVTVEDHFLTGGLFSIVAEVMALSNVSTNILPIAFQEKWFKPALMKDVLEYEKLRGEDIAERVEAQFIGLKQR
jgi:transketolase